ncbi:MAG: RNA polymerase sigma factor [Pseudomonadota bacterium]
MEVTDEALALAAAGGDAEAFSSLISRHYDRVFGLAFRLTGRREEAEDLTQDVCAALPAKVGAFRGEARFSTWLYRVVVNAAHDRRRRAAAHAKAVEGWGEVELARRAEADEAAEASGWLQAAMRGLPEELRDTLALVLEDGVTHAAAAEVLGVSEGTVSWRMSEVKKRLKALKEGAGHERV